MKKLFNGIYKDIMFSLKTPEFLERENYIMISSRLTPVVKYSSIISYILITIFFIITLVILNNNLTIYIILYLLTIEIVLIVTSVIEMKIKTTYYNKEYLIYIEPFKNKIITLHLTQIYDINRCYWTNCNIIKVKDNTKKAFYFLPKFRLIEPDEPHIVKEIRRQIWINSK